MNQCGPPITASVRGTVREHGRFLRLLSVSGFVRGRLTQISSVLQCLPRPKDVFTLSVSAHAVKTNQEESLFLFIQTVGSSCPITRRKKALAHCDWPYVVHAPPHARVRHGRLVEWVSTWDLGSFRGPPVHHTSNGRFLEI